MKTSFKTLILAALLGLSLLAPLRPASALSALIPKGQAGTAPSAVFAPVLLVDSATAQTGQAGLASTATETVELPGTNTFIAATGTFVDGTGGNYKYFPSASETATPGILFVRVTAPGVVQYDTAVQVVGFDPASDLGAALLIANLDTKISTRQPSGPVALQAGQNVTASNFVAGPTLDQIKALLPANFGVFSVDSTGGVKVVSLPTAPAGYGPAPLTNADASLVVSKLLATPLFPAEPTGLTILGGWQDTWANGSGPSAATYPDGTHQNTAYTTPGGAGQHTTILTTNTAGKPISRTTTRPAN